MKKVFLFILGICLIFPVVAMGGKEVDKDGRPVVAVSFDAIKGLVQTVGKEKIQLVSIVPNNVDAHNYEPRRKEMEAINQADLIFINGLGMEEWVEHLVEDKLLDGEKIVDLSTGLNLIELDPHTEKCPHCGLHHHHHCGHDPHIWLGLTESAEMAKTVGEALAKIDSANAKFYKDNAKTFSNEVLALRNEYKKKISGKTNRTIVVGHSAFAYLCRDLDLEQKAVRGTFNTGEASAKMLAELVQFCKENNVKVIFSEEAASPEVAQTLARDANAKVELLYTMEQASDELSVLKRHQSNLKKIYESLD